MRAVTSLRHAVHVHQCMVWYPDADSILYMSTSCTYRYIQSHGPQCVRVVRAVAEDRGGSCWRARERVHQRHLAERHRDAITTSYSARSLGCTHNEQLKHVSSGNGHGD